jgi:hypothetical protein
MSASFLDQEAAPCPWPFMDFFPKRPEFLALVMSMRSHLKEQSSWAFDKCVSPTPGQGPSTSLSAPKVEDPLAAGNPMSLTDSESFLCLNLSCSPPPE